MGFKLLTPATYGHDGFDFERTGWFSLGWCPATKMVREIKDAYGLDWAPTELIERFGTEIEVSKKFTQGSELYILLADHENDSPQKYSKVVLTTLQKSGQNFYVPLGWAKDVCAALANDGRRVRMNTGGIAVCNEDGVILYKPRHTQRRG